MYTHVLAVWPLQGSPWAGSFRSPSAAGLCVIDSARGRSSGQLTKAGLNSSYAAEWVPEAAVGHSSVFSHGLLVWCNILGPLIWHK
jgi:hypothetical protein